MIERPRAGERAVLVRLGLGSAGRARGSRGVRRSWRARRARSRWPPSPAGASGRIHVSSSAAARPRRSRTPRARTEADLILVDHPLSPSQERNLEKLTGRRVLDRNGLILDIFAQRARSFEGKLEVELAQLKHLASRLVRGWTHLERQKGGIGTARPRRNTAGNRSPSARPRACAR